jgi:hypothetical protein
MLSSLAKYQDRRIGSLAFRLADDPEPDVQVEAMRLLCIQRVERAAPIQERVLSGNASAVVRFWAYMGLSQKLSRDLLRN